MQSGRVAVWDSTDRNRSCFNSSFSGTASMIRSAPALLKLNCRESFAEYCRDLLGKFAS